MTKDIRILLGLLVIVIIIILFILLHIDSNVNVRGLVIDDSGQAISGVKIIILDKNKIIGQGITFEKSVSKDTNSDYNFDIKIPNNYSFKVRQSELFTVTLNKPLYIPTPSGNSLTIIGLSETSSLSQYFPDSTVTETPEILNLIKYLFDQKLGYSLAIIFLLICLSISTGAFEEFGRSLYHKFNQIIRSSQNNEIGKVEFVNIEKGQVIAHIPSVDRFKKGTRVLFRGTTIDPRNPEVIRPIIGIGIMYSKVESYRFWILITKIHKESDKNANYRISKGCGVEIIIRKDNSLSINLIHLNISGKGRIYKFDGEHIFVNLGSKNGVKDGDNLEVVEPQFDLNGEYLGDIPIAKLHVIGCEPNLCKCINKDSSRELEIDSLVRKPI